MVVVANDNNAPIPTDEELKTRLTPDEYRVCKMKGTEPAFSGDLNYNKEKGTYSCKCCNTPLFKYVTIYLTSQH